MGPDQLEFAGYGFLLGLAFAGWVWLSAWWRRRELQAEVRRLKEHLNTQLSITHEGNVARAEQLDQLRAQNEQLRIAVQTWRQKPDRRELRLLQVYDHALHQLLERAPGFSTHWEGALREAEEHVSRTDRGLLAFARNWVLPRAPRGNSGNEDS